MATVHFNKELRSSIERIARAKMGPAVERVVMAKPDNSWGQRIYDILFPEISKFAQSVPNGWLKTVESIEISRVGEAYCNMTFTLPCPMPWPYKFSDIGAAGLESRYGGAVALNDSPVWDEFRSEVAAYNERVDAARARHNEFLFAVRKICEAYSTLGPALKAWPPLWDLIPEDVKDKHRQVAVRGKKEVVLDIDVGKLTAMSAAAKFGL